MLFKALQPALFILSYLFSSSLHSTPETRPEVSVSLLPALHNYGVGLWSVPHCESVTCLTITVIVQLGEKISFHMKPVASMMNISRNIEEFDRNIGYRKYLKYSWNMEYPGIQCPYSEYRRRFLQ